MVRIGRAALLGWVASLGLAACSDLVTEPTPPLSAPPSVVAPAVAPAPPPGPVRSPASEALSVFYRQMEQDQIARGLLRTDGGGPDTPFTAEMLARNFMAIALFDEYSTTDGRFGATRQATPLRRWTGPIRMAVQSGGDVPAAESARAKSMVAAFSARLSRLTGVPISQTTTNPNVHVLFLSEDERRASGDRFRALLPGIDESVLRYIVNLPRDELCVVAATFDATGTVYSRALVIIRAEHPPLMAEACIHEELAQGMGLANDSPRARPSIFNDDEEFGLLTTQDELMLRMLYDPRLRPGMSAAEAEPIVRQIASDLVDPVT